MSFKKFFIISLIISLLMPFVTHAQIKITEVMYDPEGSDTKREWIEVFNSGSEAIDLSTYFFFEADIYHKLVAQSESFLQSGAYAIIVGSVPEVLADYLGFSGMVFDSVFSLNNTGETIAMANSSKEIIDSFTYTTEIGANNDGNSLQINGTTVITTLPTFGLVNKTESELPPDDDSGDDSGSDDESGSDSGSGSGGSTHEQQSDVSNYNQTALFKIGAGRKRIVSIHTPVNFEATVSKDTVKPRYIWNFGDFETDKGSKTTHIYEYPGIYEVVLEGKDDGYTSISRTQVHVIEPDIDMVVATTTLSIHNKLKKEINLGGFLFKYTKGFMKIPRNTIIGAGTTLTVNRDISKVLQSFEYPDGEIYLRFDTIE